MPIEFLLLGGGVSGFLWRGGWKCQFYFHGRGDFSENRSPLICCNLLGGWFFTTTGADAPAAQHL